jgi:hypothetical protein
MDGMSGEGEWGVARKCEGRDLGAMLTRLVCKDSIDAIPPRKHAEAPNCTPLPSHAFAVVLQARRSCTRSAKAWHPPLTRKFVESQREVLAMGMDRKVSFITTAPIWPRLAEFCAARQFPLTLMMVDGALSFPDEQPPDAWQDLRVGTPLGIVTLRRESDGVRVVTWGNAEGPLLEAWNKVIVALAEAFGGTMT